MTIREAGGSGSAKSARRAAAICQHMLSFLSQSDHYGPIGNKQMSSSAWQSTMMNNHGCHRVMRVRGGPCHRRKVTQGDGGAADQNATFSSPKVRWNKGLYSTVGRRAKTEIASDVFSAAERISQVVL